jgi:predicted RNA-binding Zn ribbon-like protein
METPKPPSFLRLGGHPVLDFVNTVGGKRLAQPRENIHRFADLVAFGSQASLLEGPEAKELLLKAAAQPAAAQKSLERARDFRELLYRLLLALVEGRPAPTEALAALDAEVHKALAGRRLEATASGRCAFTPPPVTLQESVVPRLALAAVELLTGQTLTRVRVCEATKDDGCGWLFLDTTRNHSRRWCEMATCGNQHKARRHYARVRARA